MKGEKAERKLKEHGGNCHLIRHSQARDTLFLSVKWESKSEHFPLNITRLNEDELQYEIERTEQKFDNLSKMLEYFKSHPLDHDIGGIGEPCSSETKTTSV